ncbi:LAGLIDADG family homing endonuclease [Natronorubrum tibetense]|uniref:DNA helicase n=1 Tax=Natronorubrum tibetense GA33 TaxID=1114856 RepID=L9VHE4_9EURY|nr:LAGLIDADG family homing endonuclease [Natronorubrum tibetense]ELY36625.1 ATPase involved in replication control, cdc46/mcm family protein [Natronorubrum tibetense GA33]
MAQAGNTELVDAFEQFFRNYYDNEIKQLAQRYPNEQRSLHIDWQDLYRYDPDLADDYLNQPEQLQRYAEEALRLYDLPIDVSLGQAHVRIRGLPETEAPEIREIRARDMNSLVQVHGIIRKATDVRPKIEEAAFECQLCGTLTRIPQSSGDFQEPHECQGCERQGPFKVNFDQSEFVDSQKLRMQESPEGLRGGETPQSLDVHIEDDITGEVTPGDHVSATGVLRLEQQGDQQEKSPVFDFYMEGMSVDVDEEQFEDMDITDEDKKAIYEISNQDDVYEQMVASIAPSIYGYEQEKLAMILQLFSGVTKQLPDGSRIRGDLHMLLIGDPGTGKCVRGDTKITLADGRDVPIRDLVESNLEDPKPIDDGWYDEIDLEVPSLQDDGSIAQQRATKVWKRDAPDQMYRVRTSSGRELEVTPSHPLFVQDNGQFKPVVADELAEGQFVAAPRSLSTEADDTLDIDYRQSKSRNAVQLDLPAEWTPSLARLIGYIVAEGYVEQRDDSTGYVSITNNDREVLDDAASALEKLGLNTTEREPHESKDARELLCSAGEFVSFLKTLEPRILRSSDEQRVPDCISRASADTKSEFLKAFIEGEGHVSESQREITAASMSRDLLENVRTLLLSVGIRSQLHERQNGSYRLRISGNEFETYVSEIGFITRRKQEAAAQHTGTAGNTNLDIIPNIGSELRQIRESLALAQADCGLPRSTYQHYERGSRNPSRESLRKVVTAFKNALPPEESQSEETAVADGGSVKTSISALEQFVEGEVCWERIESIETVQTDYDWVYDLEIEGTHNYISNGVISHNSQMIGYIKNIAPRAVYTSGKGSSSAGLTAAAVRDDFGDGQQWTLEAGALVLADRGIAAVDELDKMRCVTGDTLVHTYNGIKPVRELAHEAIADGSIEEYENGRTIRDVDVDVWTMAENGNVVKRDVLAIHEYDAPEELRRVELESGEQLTTTADHPFFILEDGERKERQAQHLHEGDWVYVPEKIPAEITDGGVSILPAYDAEPEVDHITAAHGAILGYIAGDGNIFYDRKGGSYGFRFTNKEEELLTDFEEACEVAFNTEAVRHPSEQRSDGVETVRVHGKQYVDDLLESGANLETYDGKRLPGTITNASRETKAAFVRALADSEGTVDERAVKIHSSSYELLLGTKMLLLEFGISSQIQTRNHDEKRDLFILAITSDQSLNAFERHIGFTLGRKQHALERACERTTGTRTILDVLPECGELFEQARGALRLHQSECGLESDATYCNFENGDANASLRLSKTILETFEERKAAAGDHHKELASETSWERLAELREQYHVSQRELAAEMSLSQQQLSARWGTDTDLRERVRNRLREQLTTPASVNLEPLRTLVENDVKWRRVKTVDSVDSREHTDTRVRVLEQQLADELGTSTVNSIRERARSLLETDEPAETWDELRGRLEAYGISFQQVANEMEVAGSTVSRWFSGAVEVNNFETVRSVCTALLNEKRQSISELLEEIERRDLPRVYDLTVEGTHNFIANGMVVHNSEDRSAMHEALEQQKISVSKAGINATLKSRCSLLGAANPKYGRFDHYEPISEQIDLEPALISRFDLIFTVTDEPDEEKDRNLAEHIINTNYAGELTTQQKEMNTMDVSSEEIEEMTEKVDPEIDADLLRKYIAYSKQNCHPRMTEVARNAIRDFYVDLRSKGTDDDAPIPVTARKLEALVRLSEASARVRLSDTVEESDANRVIEIVRSCLQDIGVDPETGEFDADIVEAGTSKSQRDRIKNLKQLISDIEEEYDDGAPVDIVMERAEEIGMDQSKAEHEIEKLKQKGEVYEPSMDNLRTT